MSEDNTQQDSCPYFRETQEKIRNNDIGAKDPWRFVKRVRCDHADHKSNSPRVVGSAPQCQGDTSECEIPKLWQT